ncbi:MAG TPA: FecR family protein, partial [Gemmatimonadaceae bacterium]|nr:FecR family protein [Gemmatimonadaceae bacterium]
MSAPFAPIDRDVLTGFRGSDEHALEQIFRSEYAALTELAAAESGEPASAARIVEGAFVDAWNTRERLESPAALEDFLRREVHTRAVREKSRRAAAHRLSSFEGGAARAGQTGPATVDEAWSHLEGVLHAPPPDTRRSARLVAEVTRRDAAEHVAAIAKKRSWVVPAAAIVAAVIVLSVLGRWLDRASRVAQVDSALASPDVRVVSTQLGQRATATLLDGSEAQLAPDTKLTIPPGFAEKLRAVKLEGAASFTVAPGSQLPFIVRAKGVRITATGTAFDVSAFPDDQSVIVRVREGEVQVKVGEAARARR